MAVTMYHDYVMMVQVEKSANEFHKEAMLCAQTRCRLVVRTFPSPAPLSPFTATKPERVPAPDETQCAIAPPFPNPPPLFLTLLSASCTPSPADVQTGCVGRWYFDLKDTPTRFKRGSVLPGMKQMEL